MPDSLLEKIESIYRDKLRLRAADGDEDARAILAFAPTQITKLGPALESPLDLVRIEKSVLDERRPRDFCEYGRLRWITSGSTLEKEFVALVMHNELPDPATSASNKLSEKAALISELMGFPRVDYSPTRGSWSAVQCKRLLERAQHASNTIDGLWRRAFIEGRILVFERRKATFHLRHPQDWSAAPPIEASVCANITEKTIEACQDWLIHANGKIHRMNFEEEFSNLASSPHNRLFQFEDQRYLGRPTRRETLAVSRRDAVCEDDQLKASRSEFHFLITGQLPSEMIGECADRFKGKGPRNRNARQLEEQLRIWFKTWIDQQSERPRKTFALQVIIAEAERRTSIGEGWKRMAERIWKDCAPEEWKTPGRR